MEIMSALKKTFARMKVTVLEFIDRIDEVKQRINKVKETLLLEFTTIVNKYMPPLQLKDGYLEAMIKALKMEILKLKEDNSHKAVVEPLKMEVQELKTELLLCNQQGERFYTCSSGT